MSLLSVDATDPGNTRVVFDRSSLSENASEGKELREHIALRFTASLPDGEIHEGSSCDDGIPARHPSQQEQFEALASIYSAGCLVRFGDFADRHEQNIRRHARRVDADGEAFGVPAVVDVKPDKHADLRSLYEQQVGLSFDRMTLSQRKAFGGFVVRATRRASVNPVANARGAAVICVDTQELFASAAEAGRSVGRSGAAIFRAINTGGRCGDYTWRRANGAAPQPANWKSKRVLHVASGVIYPSIEVASRQTGCHSSTIRYHLNRPEGNPMFRLVTQEEYLAARKGAA